MSIHSYDNSIKSKCVSSVDDHAECIILQKFKIMKTIMIYVAVVVQGVTYMYAKEQHRLKSKDNSDVDGEVAQFVSFQTNLFTLISPLCFLSKRWLKSNQLFFLMDKELSALWMRNILSIYLSSF